MNWITGKPFFQCLTKLWRSEVAQIYRDAFEGYKTNRQWFAGIYFWFRLIMFLVYCLSPTIFLQYFLQEVFILALLVLVAIFRPYKNNIFNCWDITLLFNLGLLNLFALYMFVNSFSLGLYIIEAFLVFLPLVIYIVGYMCRKSFSKIKSGKEGQTQSTRVRGLIQLTRHLSVSGEDIPLVQNADSDFDKRAEEKNTYKASKDANRHPPTTTYVELPK